MARVPIPITNVGELAVNVPAVTAADTANNHELAYNDGRVWLEVENTDGVTMRTFTLLTPGSVGALAVKENGFDVPASTTILVGPLLQGVYNQRGFADLGKVYLDPSHAALRFRAFHLGPVLTGPRGGILSTTSRTRIPVTELFTEEHLAALVRPAYVTGDPANDHELAYNDGRVILEINNLAGTPLDAVLNVEALAGGPRETPGGPMEIADNTITVPASGRVMAGGFDPNVYNPGATLTLIPAGGGTKEAVSRIDINVDSNQLQFRAFHLPVVVG